MERVNFVNIPPETCKSIHYSSESQNPKKPTRKIKKNRCAMRRLKHEATLQHNLSGIISEHDKKKSIQEVIKRISNGHERIDLSSIRIINNQGNDSFIDSSIIEQIAKALIGSNVRRLSLGENPLTYDMIKILADVLPKTNITHLNLGNCKLSDSSLYLLIEVLPKTKITHLYLYSSNWPYNNRFSEKAWSAFIQSIPLTNLTHLDLAYNKAVYETNNLKKLLSLTQLIDLDISLWHNVRNLDESIQYTKLIGHYLPQSGLQTLRVGVDEYDLLNEENLDRKILSTFPCFMQTDRNDKNRLVNNFWLENSEQKPHACVDNGPLHLDEECVDNSARKLVIEDWIQGPPLFPNPFSEEIKDEEIIKCINHQLNSGIEELNLSGLSRIGEDDEIDYCVLNDVIINSLKEALPQSNIKKLILANNRGLDIASIMQGVIGSSITHLDIKNCFDPYYRDQQKLGKLALCLPFTNIEYLDVSGNDITSEEWATLAEILPKTKIKRLSISKTDDYYQGKRVAVNDGFCLDKEFISFLQAVADSNVIDLDIKYSCNRIKGDILFYKELAKILSRSQIQILRISHEDRLLVKTIFSKDLQEKIIFV